MPETEGKVVLLVGPTCVGKTGASIELARRLDTEIVSADSMQIYRHMDIGTEKPSPGQLARVRHHMVDIVEPWETYSAGRYVEDARPIMDGLHGRGRVPIVTGGTGLYIKAMTRGLFKGPGADWRLRGELRGESTGALHARLRQEDPETADLVAPDDRRRIIRALEVCALTGRRMSEIKRELTEPLPYDFAKVALSRDREELYPMIEGRVEEMMRRGLLGEVERVLAMNPSRTAMQAIGYKELKGYLEGEYSLGEAVSLIKRNTRRYAKRQFTWFRSEEGLRWVDVTGVFDPLEIAGMLLPALVDSGLDLQ
jgi:tRNA dimethylallyltransferase